MAVAMVKLGFHTLWVVRLSAGCKDLSVLAHRKYRCPSSRPHLIDHIFGGKNNSYSIISKAVLLSGA